MLRLISDLVTHLERVHRVSGLGEGRDLDHTLVHVAGVRDGARGHKGGPEGRVGRAVVGDGDSQAGAVHKVERTAARQILRESSGSRGQTGSCDCLIGKTLQAACTGLHGSHVTFGCHDFSIQGAFQKSVMQGKG